MRLHTGAALLACFMTANALCAPPTRPDTTFLRMTDAMAGPNTLNPNKASGEVCSIKGIARPVISQHPAGAGQPLARLAFTKITLPSLKPKEQLLLLGWTSVREGFDPITEKLFDGVRFIVQVNNMQLYSVNCIRQNWTPFRVDLSAYAGKTVTISLLTDPNKRSNFDWAIWGNPQIIIKGRPSPMVFLDIPQLQMKTLQARPLPQRVRVSASITGVSAVGLLDPSLELSALTKTVPQANGQAPWIAAGEGNSPLNHTIVRVLNEFSLPTAQFLAYPASVRGGVTVRRLRTQSSGLTILTAPATNASVRKLRLYTQDGLLIREITVPDYIKPPFKFITGRFLPDMLSDQIAVTSNKYEMNAQVYIVDEMGHKLKTISGAIPTATGTGEAHLAAHPAGTHDSIICQRYGAEYANYIQPASDVIQRVTLPESVRSLKLYPSVFNPDVLWAGGNDPVKSLAYQLNSTGDVTPLDLGRRENNFYIQWYWPFGDILQDGQYVKFATHRHLRTDNSQNVNLPKILAGDLSTLDQVPYQEQLKDYTSQQPSLWSPSFTHRQSRHTARDMMNSVDPITKLPAYAMLTRTNRQALYGEFDTVDFFSSTYATGSPILDSFYNRPHQAFLRSLFTNWKQKPENIAMLEPNHEHEIAVEADGTFGDYNPLNLQNFADYIRQTEGNQLSADTKKLGAPFTSLFDAPRQNERGGWDNYERSNPLFASWVEFNRVVVSRNIAKTLANALAAGFPPELLTTHQIPDTYAIGNLSAFSNVTSRITPIDWVLNAGTSYGFTRYGVWYNTPHDALSDANRAGQNLISIGEYQALTDNAEDAYNQLKYLKDHGVVAVHCMDWPKAYDKGYNKTMDEAIRRLIRENDTPRPGITGGVGEIQGYIKQGQPVALACIGTGRHAGMIKSVNATGEWTGDVYVTPFHARILVRPLTVKQNGVGPLPLLDSGMQVELNCKTSSANTGKLIVKVLRHGQELPRLGAVLPVSAGNKPMRYTLRAQFPLDGLVIRLIPQKGVSISGITAVLSEEDTPRLPVGKYNSSAHQGGVNFAILQ